jgi:hypothetical protein
MLRAFQHCYIFFDNISRPSFRVGTNKLVVEAVAIPACMAVFTFLWWNRPRLGIVSGRGDEQTENTERNLKKTSKRGSACPKRNETEIAPGDKLTQLENVLSGFTKTSSTANQEEKLCFACVDVEAWEKDTKLITEIGMAFFYLKPGDASCFRHRHLLIAENLSKRNGRYVEDNRDSFLFGNSETLSQSDAVIEVNKELKDADYIVGHALAGDIAWLRSIGVTSVNAAGKGSGKKAVKAAGQVTRQAKLVDTQELAAFTSKRTSAARLERQKQAKDALLAAKASEQEASVIASLEKEYNAITKAVKYKSNQRQSLKMLAEAYDLMPAALHNGANDAAFTLQVMLSQCGFPFDPPPQTPSRHVTDDPIFIKAQAAANELASLAGESNATNDELIREVEAFAHSLAQGIPPLEKVFSATLDAAQRRAVHEAAFACGLSSCSQGSGTERFVAVRSKEAAWPSGDVYVPDRVDYRNAKNKWNNKRGKKKSSASTQGT